MKIIDKEETMDSELRQMTRGVTYQTNKPILTLFSKTRIPVGVKPSLYSRPSFPITVCKSTPYISNHRARLKYSISHSAGVKFLKTKNVVFSSFVKKNVFHFKVFHLVKISSSNFSFCFSFGKNRNSEIVSIECSSLVKSPNSAKSPKKRNVFDSFWFHFDFHLELKTPLIQRPNRLDILIFPFECRPEVEEQKDNWKRRKNSKVRRKFGRRFSSPSQFFV